MTTQLGQQRQQQYVSRVLIGWIIGIVRQQDDNDFL